jgi:hypothetical protein
MGVAKCLSQDNFGSERHLASQLLASYLPISSLFSIDRLDTEDRVPTLEVTPFARQNQRTLERNLRASGH